MLKLPMSVYDNILKEYSIHTDDISTIESFLISLKNSYETECERQSIELYIDGIRVLLNGKLDLRNITTDFDNACSLIKGNKSSILLFPIEVRLNSYCGHNMFLLEEHKNNVNGETIDIEESEIMDVIFFLNSHKLFSDTIISKYVDSTSKYTLSHFRTLMEEEDKGQSDKVSDKKIIPVGNISELVFDDDLKIYRACNQGYHRLDNTLDDLISWIGSDVKKIINSNRLNTFYIRNYLHPYLEYYLLKIEQIINIDNSNGIRDLIKLMNSILIVFNEYNHELTRYVLSVIYLVTKLSGIKYMGKSQDVEMLDTYMNRYINKPVLEMCKETSCNIFAMMKMIDFTIEQNNGSYSDEKRLMDKLIKDSQDKFDYLYQLTGLSENSKVESINENHETTDRIEPMISQAITALNEAFEIRKDGTIKVVLKGRVSLMDEYAANHRLLKLNEQSNDIDSMKYNLVYALLIVESADRILHNPKISKSSQKYQDAEKAKSFATNDIVTYLPKIKLRDKSFDLNTFYKKVRADEYTIEVDSVSTISGVKNIMKAILAK